MPTMDNRRTPILSLFYSSLRRWRGELLSSSCPACEDGVLAVKRDPTGLSMVPEDQCMSCGQRVSYADESIAGFPVLRSVAKPRRKKDWIGRRVRLRASIVNTSGDLFREGEVMEVRRNFGGLELRSLFNCEACHHGHYRAVKGVREDQVELLSRSMSRMADSRDPSLILVFVRRVLIDGLKYHEHDGHSIPKKVVREALMVLGVPEDEQP